MSTESDKSSPAPTKHDEDDKRINQSTEVERPKSNFSTLAYVIVAIIVIVLIIVFAGGFS